MEYYSTHINKLIEQLSHLPGIGPKSAQRLAFHIMNMPKDQVEQLTSSITGAQQPQKGCRYDHGRGKYEGSCGIRKNGKI